MTDRELMQQALEALDGVEALLTSMNVTHLLIYGEVDKAITALRERLAQPEQDSVCAHGIGKTKCSFCHQPQPEQEPVATVRCINGITIGYLEVMQPVGTKLYTTPPQRKPLTEKRIEELYSFWVVDCQDIVGFARAVERTVKGEA